MRSPTGSTGFTLPTRRARRLLHLGAVVFVCGVAALALAGCGGDDGDAADEPATHDAAPMASAAEPAPEVIATPLLDDGGRPNPPDVRTVPLEPEARTHDEHYASWQQVDRLGLHDDDVLTLHVNGNRDDGVDGAVQAVLEVMALRRLGPDTLVFVSGEPLSRAARAVDRLAGLGLSRAYLVTMP